MEKDCEEKWEVIEGFKNVAISNFGRVKGLEHLRWCVPNNSYSKVKEKILRPSNCNSKKYWRIGLTDMTGKRKTFSVHRLVAQAFISNPYNKPQVNHIDGNRDNNHFSNLEWVTNKENSEHAWKTGLRDNAILAQQGENSHLNKYSEELLSKIPDLVKSGLNYKEVSDILGIPSNLISEIKSGRAWKHLKFEIPPLLQNFINKNRKT